MPLSIHQIELNRLAMSRMTHDIMQEYLNNNKKSRMSLLMKSNSISLGGFSIE